jgi:predicted NBD/HSP70 family sugar kinase
MAKLTSPDIMKQKNKKKVLKIIYTEKNIYRAKIAEMTHMSTQTVTNITKELLNEELIYEVTLEKKALGRNPMALSINESGMFVIGVEISVRSIRTILTDFSGKVLLSTKKDIEKDVNVIDILKESIEHMLNGFDYVDNIKGIGITVEGIVNADEGIVVKAVDLNLYNVNIKEELEYLGIPILLENDVNGTAIVEKYRYNKTKNFMLVKLDSGIGASFVLNDELLSSTNNVSGEFGHTRIYRNTDIKKCKCGRSGCLTTEASIGALKEKYQLDYETIKEEVENGNTEIRNHLIEIAKLTGQLLSNVIVLLDLDEIILTGRLINDFNSILYDEIKTEIQDNIPGWVSFRRLSVLDINDIKNVSTQLAIENYFR